MKAFVIIATFSLFSLLLLAESQPVPEKSLQEKAQDAFDTMKQKTQELIDSMQESANRALETARTKWQEFMNSTSIPATEGEEQNGQDWIGFGKNIIASFKGTSTTVETPILEN